MSGPPPACLWIPPGRVGSYVDDVGAIAEAIGMPLDPSQLTAVDALTSYGRHGRWLSIEQGIEAPRQNGKTGGVLLPIVLARVLLDQPDLYLWTAHQLDTSSATLTALLTLIEGNPWLSKRVKRIDLENGSEGVHFTNGSRLNFRARSARRGRGLAGGGIVVDEALFWTGEQAGAMLPVLATRSITGNPWVLYASSAGRAESEYLRSLRARAMSGRDLALTWVGWWARGGWADPGCKSGDCSHEKHEIGCSLDNVDLWAESNPALGTRISVEFLRAQRQSMPPLEFGREYLGWQQGGDEAIDLERWSSLVDTASVPRPRPVALAIDVSSGLKSAAVVAAGYRDDGLMHVELLDHGPGVDWLPEVLERKQVATGAVIHHLGGSTPVGGVLPALGRLRLKAVGATDYAASCGALQANVASGALRHMGDPILNAAMSSVTRRAVGDGSWVISRKASSGDITPAVALALASWALAEAPTYDLLQSVR